MRPEGCRSPSLYVWARDESKSNCPPPGIRRRSGLCPRSAGRRWRSRSTSKANRRAGQRTPNSGERPRDEAADGSSSRTEPFSASSSETRAGAANTWPAWVTAGAGVLAFGFGAVELYLWRRDQNAFDTHLATTPPTHHDCGEQEQMRGGPGCQDLYEGAVRSRTLAVVGFAAGVGLGVASVLLWRSSHEPQKHEQAFACVPQLADRGVECLWRF